MNIFFTILTVIFLSSSSFAGEVFKSKSSDKSFEELDKFLKNNEKNKVVEEGESINIKRGQLVSNPFSEFKNNAKSFSTGGFISITEYKETTREKLDYAYKALSAGHTEVSIKAYQDILKKMPDNKYAMFGLATAYHYNKQNQKAIDTYKKVLAKHPDYKDAFNNLMVLLSNEYPSKAILELKKLEKEHPNFAPIPAQIGVIHYKARNYKEAIKHLTKAVKIEPSNVMYRYNLAVAYDKIGDATSAKALYKQLLTAHSKGERIPVSEDDIIDRLALLDLQ